MAKTFEPSFKKQVDVLFNQWECPSDSNSRQPVPNEQEGGGWRVGLLEAQLRGRRCEADRARTGKEPSRRARVPSHPRSQP